MDPVMRSARVFLMEAEALWRERPERVLPLVAETSERGEMVKALRLAELAPGNRRPLFLYEAPFADADGYFDGLAQAIGHDCEAVRKGVAEEGVELPPFSTSPIALGSFERAVLAMETAAALLGERFDGATVALVPERVEREPAWRDSVRALDQMARSPRVRLAVHAPPGGPFDGTLGEEGARFHVDQEELMAFLAEQGSAVGEGPAIGPRLRALLLAAAASTTARQHTTAAQRYEEAAALCASEGRVLEEAMARMGSGGACLAAEAPDLAVESYRKAAGLAEGEKAWALACQAWLGVGGAYLLEDAHARAAVSYRAAAEAARRAEIAPLRAQALRMASTCLQRLGHDGDADAARIEAESLERTMDLDAARRRAFTETER
jgi:tetratricopeptide (TPR) repeat protein